jgi:hypothetical protein
MDTESGKVIDYQSTKAKSTYIIGQTELLPASYVSGHMSVLGDRDW